MYVATPLFAAKAANAPLPKSNPSFPSVIGKCNDLFVDASANARASGVGPSNRTPSTHGLFVFHYSSKIYFEVINPHTVGSLTIPRATRYLVAIEAHRAIQPTTLRDFNILS